jgi:hypothetical protein
VRVPISDTAVIDLEAPVLPAYEIWETGGVVWVVWCQYCLMWHPHEGREGHHSCKCEVPISTYSRTGYNLSLRGLWQDHFPDASPGDFG